MSNAISMEPAMYRKIVLTSIALFLASLLQGCAGMADSMSQFAGLGVISQEKSTFDGATIISMSPTFLYSGQGMSANNIRLGARWNSKFPDQVVLIPSFSSSVARGGSAYANISGMEVNIGGEIQSFRTSGLTQHESSSYNPVSRDIYTKSEGAVVVTWDVLQKMMAATDCRVRIHSGSSYEDSIFSVERIPGGQSTVKFSLKEFILKVDAVRGAR